MGTIIHEWHGIPFRNFTYDSYKCIRQPVLVVEEVLQSPAADVKFFELN